MEKMEVRFEDPVRECGITIIPFARILKSKNDRNDFLSFLISKEPATVIIRQGGVYRIFNEEWKEVSPEDFIRDFPGNALQLKSLIGCG